MPEGPDGKTIIIVKKVSGHGGAHGGAWKVAFADFVTAMMALFLVLWLVNSASVTTRDAVASYFQRPGVFEMGSGSPLEIGGGGILSDTFSPPADAESQTIPHHKIYEEQGSGELSTETGGAGKEQQELENLASELEQEIKSKSKELGSLLGQIELKVDQQGLHLEIMDTDKTSMFSVGSAEMTKEAKNALSEIAAIILKLPNPIDIEGHTDATPFKGKIRKRYDNWNLSTDRANAARRIFQDVGMQNWQIARVVGFAAQRLKKPVDPYHTSNRRISISMRFTERASEAFANRLAEKTTTNHPKETNLFGKKAPEKKEQWSKGGVEFSDLLDDNVSGQVGKLVDESAKQSTKSGLKIEVSPVESSNSEYQGDGTSSQEPGNEGDMIFGNENPFFGKGVGQ